MKEIVITDRYNNCFEVVDHKHRFCKICQRIFVRTAIKKHYAVYHKDELKRIIIITSTDISKSHEHDDVQRTFLLNSNKINDMPTQICKS